MGELTALPNIGPVVAQQLEAVGIHTRAELEAVGTETAWLRIQGIDPSACIHRLLGIEGAIRGIPKAHLPQERKAELRTFYQEHKL